MFENLVNFFQGKGWVSNSQLDEEKRRRAQQQPSPPRQQQPAGTISVPGANQSNQIQALPMLTLQKPQPQPKPQQPEQRQPGFWESLGAGFQQAAGAVADTALQGGGLLGQIGALTNPFKDDKGRQEQLIRSTQGAEASRRVLHNQRDITGGEIVGNRDVDENARRIASGQGGLEDYARVLGKGFDVANAATSFVPVGTGLKLGANLVGGGAKATAGNVLQAASPLLRESALFGSTATVADILSERGVSPESLALNYGLPVAFGGAGAVAGAGFRSSRNAFKNRLVQAADDIERTVSDTPTSQLGKIDDGISSETVAQAKRQSAQDAANRLRQQADQIQDVPEAQPPIAQTAPDIDMPMVLERASPDELRAQVETGNAQAIDEVNRRFDEAQQAIDADTVAPAPEVPVAEVIQPAQAIDNRLESPMTTQSREIAENTVPVNPEVIQQAPVSEVDVRLAADAQARELGTPATRKASELTSYEGAPDRARVDEYKQRIASGEQLEPVVVMRDSQGNLGIEDGKHRFQAYQEMGIEEIPTVERSSTPQPDQRISQLYQEAEGHIARADEILAREGTDVGKLGEKLYVADVEGRTAQLTPAEREAFDYLNNNLDDAKRTLLSQKIIDEDIGVRRDYLPTGDEAGIERVFTPEDINASTFNYAKGRSGGFINPDGTVSDKLPKGIRAAYTDYYVRGKGSKYLSDSQVDEIRTTRIAQNDINDAMFGPSKEPVTGLDGKPVKVVDETQITKNAEDLVKLERSYADAVKSGDEATVAKLQKEVNQKTIDNSVAKVSQMKKEIDRLVKETKDSTLPRAEKTARIVELENRLEYAVKQARYQQSYVKTNLLFQVPGRVADQVGKLTQSIGDALTSPLTRGVDKAFRPTTPAGRKAARTVARDPILNQRKNNYILNKSLSDATADNALQKATGRYTAVGTRATELGSRQSAPTKDTARYFAAQAEANGVSDITSYIRDAIGTKEWDRVYNQFSTNRNRFSGIGDITGSTVRSGPGMSKSLVNSGLDKTKSFLNDAIDKAFATTLPRSVRRNMADAISIPLVGFPRVVWNVGAKGMDHATLGLTSLFKASKVSVVDDATALQKALHLRDAIEGAATGTGLVGLGVLLGQSDMITGSEPEKQANGEWVPPYSLKLGDNYVELGRFIGPYAAPIMVAAAISRGDNAASITLIPTIVASQVMNNFGANSIGDTMSQIGDALNGDTSGLASRLPNMLAAFAPLSGEVNSIANATDPYQRNTKDDNGFVQFAQQLASKVPGLREQLDAKEDQFGNKIPSSPLKAVIPLNTVGSGWGDTELGTEANRLELKPSGNSKTQENAEPMANRIISTDWYKGLSDEDKKDALQSTLYSGKLGDISDTLSDEGKTALAIGTLMSPDERNKWLEDKTNAMDYHVANYENAIANDTLTAKQDNLENSSSLHYKAIASQVNAKLPYWTATLEEQYKSTSRKELMAMAPDNPIRQALLALDEARAGAGVSLKNGDHSAPKYGLGSGSGGGGKGFSFASGASVTPNKTSVQYEDAKSSWNTPLVKPLGIGEASSKVKRKVSVKRGVSL